MNGLLDNQTSNQVYMATQTRDELTTRETQLYQNKESYMIISMMYNY